MFIRRVSRSGGVTYLGQDQDSLGGGFNPRQSWSGEITQFNVWDFPLEEWMVENAAECRSDILGNVIKWQEDLWIPNEVESSHLVNTTIFHVLTRL